MADLPRDIFAERLEAARGIERRPSAVRDANDIRDLERNADRLRGLGECWDTLADELDREAMRLRAGVAVSSHGRSAPLRAEPPRGVSGLRRAAANARGGA